MSKILSKPFDATKKIIRKVFKGSPNLFTTSDLNLQVEALKRQIDSVEERVAVASDASVSIQGAQVSVTLTYVEAKGCRFNFSQGASLTLPMSASCAVVLRAKQRTIGFGEDNDLSGATFQDGTKKPAADTVVYYDESIEVVKTTDNVSDIIALIATLNHKNGVWDIRMNTIKSNLTSVKTEQHGNISSIVPSNKTKIEIGMSYDEAFNIFQKKSLSEFDFPWTTLKKTQGRTIVGDTQVQCKLEDGVLYFRLPQLSVEFKNNNLRLFGAVEKDFGNLNFSHGIVAAFSPETKKNILGILNKRKAIDGSDDLVADSWVDFDWSLSEIIVELYSQDIWFKKDGKDIRAEFKISIIAENNLTEITDVFVLCYLDNVAIATQEGVFWAEPRFANLEGLLCTYSVKSRLVTMQL